MHNRLLVFSDLHLAPPGPLNNFHSGPALAECLRDRCQPDTLLVLNGDIFDFLQLGERPKQFVLADTPRVIQETLSSIASTQWGQAVFNALADHVRAGGHCLLIPGNHDPELAHPEALPLLRQALALSPDDERLSIRIESEPLQLQVHRWQVVIGHGHRGDGWNDIDSAQVRQAASSGHESLTFPPGSLLVLETINALKQQVDKATGAPKYAFIDLLKPEGLMMFALLLWVDPVLTLAHLPGFGVNGARTIERVLRRKLQSGPVLSGSQPQRSSDWAEELADQLVSVLSEDERKSPDMTLRLVEEWLQGRRGPSRRGLLGPGTGEEHFGRLFHAQSRDFFHLRQLSGADQRVVQAHLPEGSGPRILICGHTHAARRLQVGEERLYLNTGTWTDLMGFPELSTVQALRKWKERLLRNEVPRLRRQSYAEVTPEGGELRWWTPDPVAQVYST